MASFLVVGAVLVAGFAWYERSRPPSQVVALVAALAALAIAGRVAFAAFPNVKPTTDIVIFAGYALGGAPGFAVGALTALVSNFWFGQGPWTPWQMVSWGLCGVLGAALALGGRNVGRLTLAAACGLAGIAYGALLNFSLMATYGGDLSLQRFLVLEGRAIPFDLAHAIGNVVLALVAGPAMVRMLVRFRERFEWRRAPGATAPPSDPDRAAPSAPDPLASPTGPGPRLRGGGIAALVLASLLVGLLAPPRATAAGGVDGAVSWLRSVENDDGGWGASPGDDSDPAMTCWVMLGLEAAGHNPLDVHAAKGTPVDFLRSEVGTLESPGDLARTILALEGAGIDPRHFGGDNLVAELLGKRRSNGSYEDWPNSTAFATIALRTAGATGGLDKTLSWLRQVQNEDGGWGDVPGSPSTPDGTGAVMQALSPGSKAAHRGLSYLREAQLPGGGFPLSAGGAVNSQSTAWAVQGILATGGNPGSYRRGGKSAPEYIAAQQGKDGHYRYSQSSDQTPVWVTAYAIVAMAGAHYPVSSPPREPQPQPAPASVPPSAAAATPPAAAAVPTPAPQSTPSSPGGSAGSGAASGSAGSSPGGSTAPGQAVPSTPEAAPPGGLGAEEPDGSEAEASTSEPSADPESVSSSDSSSSPVGAIVVGLLAGGLLFGLGLLARRGWMRWRYGL